MTVQLRAAGFAPALALAYLASAHAQVPLADGVELYYVLRSPSATCTVDIDGDGMPDLVVGSRTSGQISWLRNEGGGDFSTPERLFESPSNTLFLDAIDLDEDGDVEIIQNRSDIWTPTASGTFALVQGTSVSGSPPVFADLDSDGQQDLLSTFGAGIRPRWRRSLGGLGFDSGQNAVDVQVRENSSVLVDMNGDGQLDLVVADEEVDTNLRLFSGDGTMPFQGANEVAIPLQQPFASATRRMIALDADGDGDQDLVLSFGTEGLWLIENLGNLSFAPEVAIATELRVEQVEGADVDGDGDLDLVKRNLQGAVVVQRNLGSGTFDAGVTIQTGGVSDFHTDDLDGDGAEEIYLVDNLPSPIAVRFDLAGSPTSTLLDPLFAIAGATDVDRDGVPDLVGIAPNGSDVVWRMRSEGGEYADTEVLSTAPFRPGRGLSDIFLGDLNGDGLEDLSMISNAPGFTDLVMRLALPGGGFGSETQVIELFPTLNFVPASVQLEDIDNDEDLDIVLLALFGNPALILRNLGAGSFASELVGVPVGPSGILKMLDVDGDQLSDMIIPTQNAVLWRKANANGMFEPSAELIPEVSRLPAFGDINGDGDLDYIVAGDSLRYGFGLGNGQYTPPINIGGSRSTATVELVDLDLDGSLELLASGLPAPSILVWELAPFFNPTMLREPALPDSLPAQSVGKLVDIDGDGDLDFLLQSPTPSFDLTSPVLIENESLAPVGVTYCDPAVANSTGFAGEIEAYGSSRILLGALELRATSLPPNAFGFFLTSRNQGLVTSVPGSEGTLCLGGEVGRFIGPGQVGAAGPDGRLNLELDLASFPSPSLGLIPVQSGQTWNFQAWHRDQVGGQPTSNFTEGLSLTFL